MHQPLCQKVRCRTFPSSQWCSLTLYCPSLLVELTPTTNLLLVSIPLLEFSRILYKWHHRVYTFIGSNFGFHLTKILRFIHAVACISRLFLVLVKLIMERKRKKEERRKEMHTENEIISNREEQQQQSNIIKNRMLIHLKT